MTDDERGERNAERAEAGLVSDPVLVALFGARP